jgi:7,8-dihydroneopterin aldolase/epimerase/oxygenase
VTGDRITVRGVRARGRHGVYLEERALGQIFVVDVSVQLDTRPAAAADDLEATVDYASLAETIVSVVEGEPVALIETLAQRIADLVLADDRVTETEVTVHKPDAPVAVPFEDITVTILRGRTSSGTVTPQPNPAGATA